MDFLSLTVPGTEVSSCLQATVRGSSMRPFLPEGSTAVIKPCATGPLPRVGEIAAFKSGTEIVLHRHLGGGRYRGDNTTARDTVVGELVGVTTFTRRPNGRWQRPTRRGELTSGVLMRFGARRTLRLLHFLLTESWFWHPLEAMIELDKVDARPPRDGGRYDAEWVGSEMAVHDRQTGDVHFLNDTAAQIWLHLRGGGTDSSALEALCGAHPGESRERLRTDLDQAIAELRRLELISGTEFYETIGGTR